MSDAETLAEARRDFPPLWVIYERPRDWPNGYVARLWYGLKPTDDRACYPTLLEARSYVIGRGACVMLNRWPDDDPAIKEAWL